MKKLLPILAVVVAIFAIVPNASADNQLKKTNETPTMEVKMKAPVQAIIFHSDSCGSCKILGPKMKKAMQAVNTDKIDVVKFDFSNKETIAQTKIIAVENNVSSILNEYGAKTGFVVLLDKDGQEVAKLNADNDVKEIATKLTDAIISSL